MPIAPPTDQIRADAEPAVERLVDITNTEQEARRDALDCLRIEFGVERPGQKLENFATLDSFVAEVRKRRSKSAGTLTPAALNDLRAGYAEITTPMREDRAEAASLERGLSDLVNQA
jgi:hypothetical protein